VRFDQIWFRYARRAPWTLSAVDAAVQPGQTVVVLGRNGAGKSTLLQLAAGVLEPTRGSLQDRPRIIGWVPERFPADQPFTAGQYLARMAAVRGLRGTAEVQRWVERLLLTEHVDTRLADLSKGTAQKVGLAQALLVRPGLLVLDEPWEGLDAVARTLIPEIVAEGDRGRRSRAGQRPPRRDRRADRRGPLDRRRRRGPAGAGECPRRRGGRGGRCPPRGGRRRGEQAPRGRPPRRSRT
jgi:ABC-type multidrug transport system ATPase subunit